MYRTSSYYNQISIYPQQVFLHNRINTPFSSVARRKSKQQPKHRSSIHAALTKHVAIIAEIEPDSTASVYNDSWFDRIAINHLSQSVQSTTGLRNSKSGYKSLVEAARVVSTNFNPKQQQELVIQSLEKAFPRHILSLIRMLLPDSKLAREFFAAFTTLFFAWLVGPSAVKESELNGIKQKNIVHIKKCRFLEESNCVGMCTSLCKIPSQTFIKSSLGIPVNMVPNFDDMSCEMVFGQEPPELAHDPAFRQIKTKAQYELLQLIQKDMKLVIDGDDCTVSRPRYRRLYFFDSP